MTDKANSELLRRAWAAFDRGDEVGFANCVSDGWCEHRGRGDPASLDQMRLLLRQLRTAFPDQHTDIHHVVADNTMVACHCTIRATHTGPLFGIEPTGKRVVVHEMMFNRVENGRLRETWTMSDSPGLMEQITGNP